MERRNLQLTVLEQSGSKTTPHNRHAYARRKMPHHATPLRSKKSPANLHRFAVDCRGFRMSFCTRQLFISGTNTTSSEGQASPCGQLNCFGPRPDSPSIPKIFPSSVSL